MRPKIQNSGYPIRGYVSLKEPIINLLGLGPEGSGETPSQCPQPLRATPSSTRAIIREDRLPVKDRSGKTLYYVTASVAKGLIAGGTVTAVGNKSTIRALKVDADGNRSRPITISAYAGRKYSHKRATDDNPAGVWTFKDLTKAERPIFHRVVLDCIRENDIE
jgi:hypothetical protein